MNLRKFTAESRIVTLTSAFLSTSNARQYSKSQSSSFSEIAYLYLKSGSSDIVI